MSDGVEKSAGNRAHRRTGWFPHLALAGVPGGRAAAQAATLGSTPSRLPAVLHPACPAQPPKRIPASSLALLWPLRHILLDLPQQPLDSAPFFLPHDSVLSPNPTTLMWTVKWPPDWLPHTSVPSTQIPCPPQNDLFHVPPLFKVSQRAPLNFTRILDCFC